MHQEDRHDEKTVKRETDDGEGIHNIHIMCKQLGVKARSETDNEVQEAIKFLQRAIGNFLFNQYEGLMSKD